MYSLLNTLSEYTYFSISKDITSYTFLLVKIVKSFSVYLRILDREKAPSNKTPTLTKNRNMNVWVAGTRNQEC